MHLAALLPTAGLFGGVKRFVELGNRFIDAGHVFTLYTPGAAPPSWADYKGHVGDSNALERQASAKSPDVLFFTDVHYADMVSRLQCPRKVFYHVLKSAPLQRVLRYRDIEIFVNSSNLYAYDTKRYRIEPFRAIGGVDTAAFAKAIHKTPAPETIRVLVYGRLSRKKKGTMLVVRACEKLRRRHPHLRLVLFDTPVDAASEQAVASFSTKVPHEFIVNHPPQKNYEIHQRTDIFVSAERNAGWCNTCAEAMASKTAVIATDSGTRDFLIHRQTGLRVRRHPFFIARALDELITNHSLRRQLAENGFQVIQGYDWDKCAHTILSHLTNESA
jgi:glycosyltransferase involved in cell wall biosynthesis